MFKGSGSWLIPVLAPGLVSFAAVGVVSTAVVFFAGDAFTREVVDQPVAFNHQKHGDEAGLECASCHTGCQQEVHSGLPAASACALCHSEPQGESAAELTLVSMLEAGAEVEWRSLFGQPAHVFFSHRRHTTVAGIECATCHGDIGQSTAPPRFRAPLAMETCIDCHSEHGASVDCSACHR